MNIGHVIGSVVGVMISYLAFGDIGFSAGFAVGVMSSYWLLGGKK